MDLPARIDQHERPADGGLVHPVVEHRKPDEPGDADPRGAGPDQHDARVAQSHPEPAQAGQDPGHDDRRGPLDVVVERRHAIAVAVQDAQRVRLLEVLPLDDAARPDLGDALDEGLDQRVVLRPAQARRAKAEVERVGEQRRVVGPDVERDRQRERRMDAAGRRVQGELADGDGHPARALVAEAEDPLVVGDDDEPDVVVRTLAQERRDAVAVGRRDPGAAGPPDDVAEFLDGTADRRRVDDRQELLEVLGEEPVEEGRVAVLERGHPDVALEGVVLVVEVLELELDLLVDRQDAVREQAAQPERVALLLAEGKVLGEQPAAEERRSRQRDGGRTSGRDVVVRGGEGTHPREDSGRARSACRAPRACRPSRTPRGRAGGR